MAEDSQVIVKNVNESSSCQDDPNFAAICSFVEHFGEMIGIGDVIFDELQQMIDSTEAVPDRIIRIHMKLLQKYFRMVISPLGWENWLIRFCHSYGFYEAGTELVDSAGYQHIKPETKLMLLKTLLEAQFDCNPRFKLQVNAMKADTIRQRPLGRDKNGQLYWCQVDSEANLRVYQENLEEHVWKTVITRKDQIDELVEVLQSGKLKK